MLSRAVRRRSQVTRRASVTSMPAHQPTATNTRESGPRCCSGCWTATLHACTEYQDERHRLDPTTDIYETLDALSDLVCEGIVRAIGASSWASLTAISGPAQHARTAGPPAASA